MSETKHLNFGLPQFIKIYNYGRRNLQGIISEYKMHSMLHILFHMSVAIDGKALLKAGVTKYNFLYLLAQQIIIFHLHLK